MFHSLPQLSILMTYHPRAAFRGHDIIGTYAPKLEKKNKEQHKPLSKSFLNAIFV